jgi:hypothetical protein
MAATKIVVVTKPWLGHVAEADRNFGSTMLDKFFHACETTEEAPDAIVFYTEGVRCAVKGSPFLLGLQVLQEMGVDLLLCGSCLEHYGLQDALALGTVSNMHEIVGRIMEADDVLTI